MAKRHYICDSSHYSHPLLLSTEPQMRPLGSPFAWSIALSAPTSGIIVTQNSGI
jgi:hypothetical protein